MFNILTLNNISKKGLNLFEPNKYKYSEDLNSPDGILLRSYKMHDMELPQNLKAVGRAGAGTNNIPIDKCTEKGIVVMNTPGANANAVKELVITGLFLSARGIVDGINWVNSETNNELELAKLVEKQKKQYKGTEIKGKTLGLIGLGAIGLEVANDCTKLGMNVIGFDPFISVEKAWKLSSEVKKAPNIDYLLQNSDYISIHAPLNDNTKNMINTESFNKMKNGVKILNFSRGEIVNDKDLIQAINDGKIDRYVTDFPNENLVNQPGIITIPHLGASTKEAEDNCAVMAVTQLIDFLENGNIKNSVNFPDCSLDITTNKRITIINKNIPAMVGQISTYLAESNLNIVEMINRSKGNIAYNIFDLDNEPNNDVLNKIAGINGIIKVRKL